MSVKFFELRDKGTFIPVFAFRTQRSYGPTVIEQDNYLLRRAGFGPESECIIMGRLECSGVERNCTYDPYSWGGRTFPVAHQYLEKHFDELESGSVIDVEFILGESETAKISEAVS